MRPAVFLDRDGTVIEHVPYISDPAEVRLLPRAAEGLRALRDLGYALVVVTNQSAVGRRMMDVAQLRRVHAAMVRQLDDEGLALDDWRFCPTAPKSGDRTIVEDPRRKPGPGMILESASELDLDVASSWMIGDMVSDVLAGRNAGCRGSLLVRSEANAELDAGHPAIDAVVRDLLEAAHVIADGPAEERHPGGR